MAFAPAILLGTGLALFSGRDALQRAYNHISTVVQAGLERHFSQRPISGALPFRLLPRLYPALADIELLAAIMP